MRLKRPSSTQRLPILPPRARARARLLSRPSRWRRPPSRRHRRPRLSPHRWTRGACGQEIAGQIVCGNHNGSWSYPATSLQLTFEVLGGRGTAPGCSSKRATNLFVLHADGSETQVTEQLSGFNDPWISRPSGATISPDGSRVVFAGLTKPSARRARSCHDGALFAVDADGGPAEVLWESQYRRRHRQGSDVLSRRDADRVRRRLLRSQPQRVGDERRRQ